MLPFYYTLPHPALRPYIFSYFFYEGGIKNDWLQADISPTSFPVLSFALGKEKFIFSERGTYEPMMFNSQTTKHIQMNIYGKQRVFYVFFQPTGAYQLLGFPVNNLIDQLFNLSDMMGSTVRELKDKLMQQTDPVAVREILESYFLDRLRKGKQQESAARLARAVEQLKSCSTRKNAIKEVCDQQGYSISRLERHMRQMVGIGPKMLQRIARFDQTLKYISQNGGHCNWARLACDFGYYDQNHFIKDFSWFFGTTPSQLEAYHSGLKWSVDLSGKEESGVSIFRIHK